MIKEKAFKILAIDGGGIKGLFSAEILRRLEEHNGNHISDYFDLICGTSTGGLIALALAVKVPTRKIVDFYVDYGPKIFPCKNTFTRTIAFGKQMFLSSKYKDFQLKNALNIIFNDKMMSDANNLLCIPSYNLTQGRPKVFKSPFNENGKNKWCNDEHLRMVDVALATSAAPTYFPIHEIKGNYYTDGGVWANNPTLVGITEAIKYFINREFEIDGKRIKYTSLQVLSISSVIQPIGWSTKRWKKRSALLWLYNNKLLPPFMEGQNYYTDYFMKCIESSHLIPIEYKRINHESLSIEKNKNIDLDKATKSALTDLKTMGNDVAGFYCSTQEYETKTFFKTSKSFKI